MSQASFFSSKKGSLRQRILTSVGAMVILSLLSSTVSLYKLTEVNRLLEAINHVSVPLGRLFTQMLSDGEVFHRELERSLGISHWKDPHWKPRPAPRWIEEVLESEMARVKELIDVNSEWTSPEARTHWHEWVNQISLELENLRIEAAKLYTSLDQKNSDAVSTEIYTKWTASVEEWKRQLQWGSAEYERSLRQNFSTTESRVAELRTGLESILIIVVLMSLLLLWLGERALRPLGELTRLAREITRRGLRKEDKSLLPEMPISRTDEVSQLAREFHHMATALLEREKTVESQKNRLQEQNRLLRDIGELNENILNSIESILIVTDLKGKVAQCNPGAVRWLGGSEAEIMGSDLKGWVRLLPLIEESPGGDQWLERLKQNAETWKLGPLTIEGRVFGGYVMPLRREQRDPHGAIIVLDDLTEEVDLQERLRRAENLAAVGRMSAQVAHEVRNPLHSIGLEAEMAAEMASRLGNVNLKQSLSSILGSVDRLQKITENYLKLSRLSDGQKTLVDLGEILESVLATYAPVCEEQSVKVDWARAPRSVLKIWADGDLLEQVLGNLFRNSLQALETNGGPPAFRPAISWYLGNTESGKVWLRIEDNGPGISAEVREKLFTPFVTTRAQGTGLGLSFIKKVLEDHGGKIDLLDRPGCRGACFELILPLLGEREPMPFKEVTYAEDFAGR
jgi:nitrogen fixation/metabolism regulation signal transduction histidine kinase